MRLEKAKQLIISRAQKDGDTCQYYVHESDAFEAISIAEEEMKQRAIESFKENCPCWSRFQQDRKCDKCTWLKDFVINLTNN